MNNKNKVFAGVITVATVLGAFAFPLFSNLSAVATVPQNLGGLSYDLNQPFSAEVNTQDISYPHTNLNPTSGISPLIKYPVNDIEFTGSYKTPVAKKLTSDYSSYFNHFFDNFPEFNAIRQENQYQDDSLISVTFSVTWGAENFRIKLFADKTNLFWEVGKYQIKKEINRVWTVIKSENFIINKIEQPLGIFLNNDLKNNWYKKIMFSQKANNVEVLNSLRTELNDLTNWEVDPKTTSQTKIENLFEEDFNFSYKNVFQKYQWSGSSIIFQVHSRGGRARDLIVKTTKDNNGNYHVTNVRVYDMDNRRGTYMNFDLTGSSFWKKNDFWDWREWCEAKLTNGNSLEEKLNAIKAIIHRSY